MLAGRHAALVGQGPRHIRACTTGGAANRFAALLLMPPPKLKSFMGKFRDPDVRHICRCRQALRCKQGCRLQSLRRASRFRRCYRGRQQRQGIAHLPEFKFPRLCVNPGDAVPARSAFHLQTTLKANPSDLLENGAELWVESDWGKRLPTLYRASVPATGGFRPAVMLWAELEEEDEDADGDERMSKERLQYRQSKRGKFSFHERRSPQNQTRVLPADCDTMPPDPADAWCFGCGDAPDEVDRYLIAGRDFCCA